MRFRPLPLLGRGAGADEAELAASCAREMSAGHSSKSWTKERSCGHCSSTSGSAATDVEIGCADVFTYTSKTCCVKAAHPIAIPPVGHTVQPFWERTGQNTRRTPRGHSRLTGEIAWHSWLDRTVRWDKRVPLGGAASREVVSLRTTYQLEGPWRLQYQPCHFFLNASERVGFVF